MRTRFFLLVFFISVAKIPSVQAQPLAHHPIYGRASIPFGQPLPPPAKERELMAHNSSQFSTTYGEAAKKQPNTTLNFNFTKVIDPQGQSFAIPVGAIANEEAVIVSAFSTATGSELFRSDGTEAGTILLNDINPGAAGSNPGNFTFKNNLNYFVANNGLGRAIYSTNGQPDGLKRVTAIMTRTYSVTNLNVTSSGQVFYILYNGYGSYQLWYSDGSENGGEMLIDGLNYNGYCEIVGNTVFFAAGDAQHGYELWKSDGTVAGTKMVKDINPGVNGSYPFTLISYKNNIYFGANDGVAFSFWKTDGTEIGTVIMKNIAPAFYDYDEEPWSQVACVSNDVLYFFGIDVAANKEGLWKTTGQKNSTVLVKIIGTFPYTFMHYLKDVKGTLYFTGRDDVRGEGIWKSGGKAKNTTYIKEIVAGGDGDYFNYYLCSIGTKVYFVNYSTYTIWASEGTPETTNEIISDGLTGLNDIRALTPAGNKLFFSAYGYGNEFSREVYVGEPPMATAATAMASNGELQVEKSNLSTETKLYPNPANNSTVLKISGDEKRVVVYIADLSGKVVWKKVFNEQHSISLPLEKLSAGIYLVTVKSDKHSKTLKLLKD